MTILQVCAYAAPFEGNFLKSLLILEKKLAQKGQKTIYAFPENAKSRPWCAEISKRTKVYFLPLAKARINPKTYKVFNLIFKENEIDIVHSHFELYDIPITVTSPKKVKIFWHLHDPIEDFYNRAGILRKLLWKLQYAVFSKKAELLSVSEKHLNFVIKLGFNKNRTRIIPNGIDTSRLKFVENENTKFDFLLFGWEFTRKGVDLALAAGSLIANGNFKMAVVSGENAGPKSESIVGSKLPFLCKVAPVDDINQLYNNADCFLHLSRSEGQSYALLEALYAGLPVICSDINENLFAKEFPTAVFIENENVTDIAEKMRKVLNGEIHFSGQDFQASRKIITEKYSVNAWSENMLTCYNQA
jgi:glycosyltransferase involved in cell wall biosynthesis